MKKVTYSFQIISLKILKGHSDSIFHNAGEKKLQENPKTFAHSPNFIRKYKDFEEKNPPQ